MLWGSHPEKKSYMCLTFCTASSPWRQLALLSWRVRLCRVEGWQKRATFTAVYGFFKHEELKQHHRALTDIGVAGGSRCCWGFPPQWGLTPQPWFSISSLLPCWIVSLLVVIDTWDTFLVLCFSGTSFLWTKQTIFLFSVHEPYFLSLSALFFGLWLV